MPLYPWILRISDHVLLCKLSGIQVDFQRHFTAGQEGKNEEFAHVYFFNQAMPVAESDFGLEIEKVACYCEGIHIHMKNGPNHRLT